MDVELNEAQVAFAETILALGILDLDPLQNWIDQLKTNPGDLGEALCESGLLNEFELINHLGKGLGVSVASDIELEMYATPHPKIPREVCVELLFVPLSEETPNPFPISISNPLDEIGLQYISELLGNVEIKLSLSAPSQIRSEIIACYGTEEEWAVYKAQNHTEQAMEKSLNDPEIETHETESQAQVIDALPLDGRPRTLPDWSNLSNGDAGLVAFKKMIDHH
jgi:hypothetical protein